MNRTQTVVTMFLAPALLALTALAADEALPKADKILDRYVEVTGGKGNYTKVKTSVISGTMSIPAQNISAKMTTYAMEPNKRYNTVEFPGIGVVEEGSDGTVAWQKSAMTGPRLKEGEEKEIAMRGTFNKDVLWRDYYTKAENAGMETVDGKQCYKILMTPKVGRPETRFYDKETGLIVKIISVSLTPMGEIQSELLLSDFVKQDGLLSPRTMNTKVAGREVTMKFDSVKYNVEISPDRFKLPADVQALVDKKK